MTLTEAQDYLTIGGQIVIFCGIVFPLIQPDLFTPNIKMQVGIPYIAIILMVKRIGIFRGAYSLHFKIRRNIVFPFPIKPIPKIIPVIRLVPGIAFGDLTDFVDGLIVRSFFT